jgi:hypothetical protein
VMDSASLIARMSYATDIVASGNRPPHPSGEAPT